MAAPVFLTVDTELTWRHLARGASWQENLALSYDAAGVGVPFQLELLRRHQLKACFFVDPMPALVYGLEPVRRMIDPILAAGQEVQLHLHPFWADVAEGRAQTRYELIGFSGEEQERLLRTARDLLVEAGAPPPVAFRAGSYSANAETLRALERLGFRYDSSHNASHARVSHVPSASAIAPNLCEGVIELPVGHIAQPNGALRHLQLCAVTMSEFKLALGFAYLRNHPLTTIVSHSFELASRSGTRAKAPIVRRFEELCAFLDERRDRLPTRFATELGDVPLGRAAEPAVIPRLEVLRRQLQHALWDMRYERSVETATAAVGTSLVAAELLLLAAT